MDAAVWSSCQSTARVTINDTLLVSRPAIQRPEVSRSESCWHLRRQNPEIPTNCPETCLLLSACLLLGHIRSDLISCVARVVVLSALDVGSQRANDALEHGSDRPFYPGWTKTPRPVRLFGPVGFESTAWRLRMKRDIRTAVSLKETVSQSLCLGSRPTERV